MLHLCQNCPSTSRLNEVKPNPNNTVQGGHSVNLTGSQGFQVKNYLWVGSEAVSGEITTWIGRLSKANGPPNEGGPNLISWRSAEHKKVCIRKNSCCLSLSWGISLLPSSLNSDWNLHHILCGSSRYNVLCLKLLSTLCRRWWHSLMEEQVRSSPECCSPSQHTQYPANLRIMTYCTVSCLFPKGVHFIFTA